MQTETTRTAERTAFGMLMTLAAGATAFYAKWLRRKADGSPFPKATAGLLGLTLALLLVFALGLLKS